VGTSLRMRRSSPGTEQFDIRTSDAWSLRADVHEPERDVIGTAVLAHAMMARRSEFYRPAGAGLARFFVERGWRTIAFDFRGHGDSGPSPREGANFGYDDFVTYDLPAVHAFARSRGAPRRLPVVLVGHSLGGHAALASQGSGLASFDGLVAVATNIWVPSLEPSRARWLVKRASLAAAAAICRRVGRFPARALRMGSDDEPRAYFEDFERFARTGLWASADGKIDYLSSLARVRVPVLQIVSDRDVISCVPECGSRFIARCGGPHEVIRIARNDEGGPPPDHMALVTGGRTPRVWERVEAWMRKLPTAREVTRSTDS
jgi:predicted alpha/beta hydrolase